MTELYIVKMSENSIDIPSVFFELADEEKKAVIMKNKSLRERKTRLYAHVAAKLILGRKMGVTPENISFSYRFSGKPYVENCTFKFNISHTDNAFAVAISERETGVDIEKLRTVDLRLCDRYFSENEKSFVLGGEWEKEKRFFRVWTRKEAYLKYTGKGISGLRDLDTESKSIKEMLETFEEYDITVSVCSDDREIKKTVLSEEEFLQNILA